MKKEQTHFGYKTVDAGKKTAMVGNVFTSVAQKYDLMNDLMSFGLHRLWKDKMVEMIPIKSGMKILDMAGGTGDISFRILKKAKVVNRKIDITVCDINAEMLEQGRARAINKGIISGISWKQGDAEKLPFRNAQFDFYAIAFGIRNVTNINNAIKEAYRVLKPGGQFICLEFSNVNNPIFKKVYDAYSFKAIPRIGHAITGDRAAYQYLVESIRKFPRKDLFSKMIERSGFEEVTVKTFNQGIVAIHRGIKE